MKILLVKSISFLKKLVRLGCITEGLLHGSRQQKVLIHQTFWQLIAAFISGNGLQSVCVLNVCWGQLMMYEMKIK